VRIDSLYISSFGGIKNLKLDFSKAFNVVYGDNENGKSTVMAFIKMMFYGNEKGGSNLSKNIRKKYTPWDGSQMAGSIDFEHSGKKYRIEREFRSSNSTDKVSLIDLDLGTREIVGADIGKRFLGLSAAAFERSVFIGQFGFPESDSEAEGELNSKLSNIVLTGDENVSFQTVFSRIEKARLSLMSKSGRAGEYDKNLKLCTELEAKLESSRRAQEEYAEKSAKAEEIREKLSYLANVAMSLKEEIAKETDIKNAQKYKTMIELKAELDKLGKTMTLSDGSIIDDVYLSKLRFCISKAEASLEKLSKKQTEISVLEKGLEGNHLPEKNESKEDLKAQINKKTEQKENYEQGLRALEKRLSELEATTEKKPFFKTKGAAAVVLLWVFGILAIVFGYLENYVITPVCAALSLVCLALTPIFISLDKTKRAKNETEKINVADEFRRIKKELSGLEEELLGLRFKIMAAEAQSNTSVLANQREMLQNSKKEKEVLENQFRADENTLLELFARYKVARDLSEVKLLLDEVTQKAVKQKEIKQQLNFIAKDIGYLSYEDVQKKLDELEEFTETDVDFKELKENYESTLSQMSEYKSQLATLMAEMKSLAAECGKLETLSSELNACKQKLISQKEFCETADIACEVLSESFAELRRSYGSELEKEASEILKKLTESKYVGMNISKSFDINVNEKETFGGREIEYLSSGAADQAYLSLRIALLKLIAGDEALPLFLDDALAQYDDNRLKQALEFLKDFASTNQVIMFTCHEFISQCAEEFSANKIMLKK